MRAEKHLLLDELAEKIENANSMILTSYQKFPPKISWNFNNELRKIDSEFEVVKKRVFIKAAEKCGISFKLDDLKGHVGVVFVKGDSLSTTKAVFKFSDENEELFQIISGILDKKDYSANELKELSKLPSLDEMRAQFLGLLEAPMTGVVSVMNSLLTSVMYCIENKTKEQVK